MADASAPSPAPADETSIEIAVEAPEGSGRSPALAGLLFLGVLFTLYFARSLVVPIVLAVLLDFLLKPLVRGLRRVGIPEAAGAAIVVLGSIGSVAVAGYQLADPARTLLATAPASLHQAAQRLRTLGRPLERLNRTAHQVQEVAGEPHDTTTREVAVKGPPLSAKLLGGAQAVITSALEVVILLYFLLAAGDLFLQKLIKLLPQLSDKKTAVAIARKTETAILTYLVTLTLINFGVGLAVAGVLFLVGLPPTRCCGERLAGVAEFVPYVGATVMVALLSLAGLATFDHLGHAALVPGAYLAVELSPGQCGQPVVARPPSWPSKSSGHLPRRAGLLVVVGVWLGAFLAVAVILRRRSRSSAITSSAWPRLGEFLGR